MLYLALFCLNIFQFTPRYPSAEVEIVNAEMMDPSEKVLFIGYANKLKVKGLESHTNYFLKSSYSTKTNIEPHLFEFAPGASKFDTITVVLNGIEIHKEVFEIKNFPRPNLGFGNSIGNQTLTREYILSNPGLHIKYVGTSLRMKLYIESYFATIIKKNGTKIPLTIKIKKGDEHKHLKEITQLIDGKTVTKTIVDNETIKGKHFLKNHIKHLRKLEIGDKIVFMVKLNCPTCKPRFLPENIYITLGND